MLRKPAALKNVMAGKPGRATSRTKKNDELSNPDSSFR
jgi:hypothetical protein